MFILFYVFCLHVCMCTTRTLGAWGGQKKELGPPELELQMVVTHCVGARNKTSMFN